MTMKNLALREALTLLDTCPVAMLLLDGNGRIRACNKSLANLTGSGVEELCDSAPNELIAPLLGTGTVVHWIDSDGNEHWLAVQIASLDDAPGSQVRFYLDITEQLRLKRERDELASALRDSALQDSRLASLLSRHGLMVALNPLVARTRRYNTPLSIVTMGIETGQDGLQDPVWRRVAALLRDQTRWADLVGCNADRDFILILQETSRDAALLLVEKLAGHIGRMDHDLNSAALQACYGITECNKNDDADSLLERAEAALAEARQNDSGRSIAI